MNPAAPVTSTFKAEYDSESVCYWPLAGTRSITVDSDVMAM